MTSQSLFYWNEPCNSNVPPYKESALPSQSLFYWNEPCNITEDLILYGNPCRHNPYFIGMNLAIAPEIELFYQNI